MSPSGHTLVDTNPRCCSCRVSKANNPSKAALSTSTWLLLVSVLIVGLIFTNICWFTVYRCLSNRVGQLSIDVRRFSIRESSLSYGRRRELQPKFAVDDASELDDDDEQMTADEVFLAAVAQETDSSLDRLVGSSVSMGKTRIRRSRSDGGARSVRNRKCKRKLKRCINQLLSKGSSRGRKGCKNKSVKCRRNRRGGRGRNCCPRRRPKPRPRKLASPIPVHTSPTPALTSSTSVSTSPISTHKPSQERVAFPPNLLRSSSALKMHYNRRIVAGSNLITVRKKAVLEHWQQEPWSASSLYRKVHDGVQIKQTGIYLAYFQITSKTRFGTKFELCVQPAHRGASCQRKSVCVIAAASEQQRAAADNATFSSTCSTTTVIQITAKDVVKIKNVSDQNAVLSIGDADTFCGLVKMP
ncbi:uncharacterized protein LOC141910746 isoform X3 [Tubulanus polymorphus]|uniref:uncharacterized protein LOC141910746 isoform X3 n=1 Tax=Tubulanus polymorphus TaxID=672921 RepID=UPI003DA38969